VTGSSFSVAGKNCCFLRGKEKLPEMKADLKLPLKVESFKFTKSQKNEGGANRYYSRISISQGMGDSLNYYIVQKKIENTFYTLIWAFVLKN
jgi:hypothetical protein